MHFIVALNAFAFWELSVIATEWGEYVFKPKMSRNGPGTRSHEAGDPTQRDDFV